MTETTNDQATGKNPVNHPQGVQPDIDFRKLTSYNLMQDCLSQITDPKILQIKESSMRAADILQEYHFFDEAACCYYYPLVYLPEANKKIAQERMPKEDLALWSAFTLFKDIKQDLTSTDKLAENIRQLMAAASFDMRVLFVRLALWLADLRRLTSSERNEQSELLSNETLQIYSKIAHRLGLFKMKLEMEQLSFKHLYPQEHAEIEQFLQEKLQGDKGFFDRLGQFYAEKFQKEHIPFHFSYRTKDSYSIFMKCQKQKIAKEQLYDLIACRFLVNNLEECYKVLAIIHSYNSPVPGRLKDYIHHPKLNGYQSLHTTVQNETGVTYEVQIRTFDMHQESEYGVAAHWGYKEKSTVRAKEREQIAWFRDLVKKYSQKDTTQNSLEDFQRELNSNSIFVFTPQGKMIRLPRGASVLDFAYAIHSEIGNHCMAANINGRIAPIRKVLESGMQVSIITHPHAKPNREWMQHCLTNKALYHIRNSIKQQSSKNSVELGDKILQKAFDEAKLDKSNLENQPLMQKFLKKKSFSHFTDLLEAVGYGFLDVQEIVQYFKALKEKPKRSISKLFAPLSNLKNTPKDSFHNLRGIPTRIAMCCQPLPGEAVVGVVSNAGLIKIHRLNCPNLQQNTDKKNLLNLRWEHKEAEKMTVALWFVFPNDTSSLNTVTACLTNLKVQIVSSNLEKMPSSKNLMQYKTVLELDQIEKITKLKTKLSKFKEITMFQEEPKIFS